MSSNNMHLIFTKKFVSSMMRNNLKQIVLGCRCLKIE